MIDCKLSLHLSSALTLNFRHTLTELNMMITNLTREQHILTYACYSVENEINGASRKSQSKHNVRPGVSEQCPTPQYLPVKYEVLHIMS